MENNMYNGEKLAKILTDLEKSDPDYEVGDPYSRQDAIRPLVATNCSEYVVAHSTHALRPARQFAEVALLPHILETMRRLGLNRLMRLQAFAWPHLGGGSGHGAMIVSAPRSGRTFAYVPVVCQAVCKSLAESRRQRMLHPGAVALILVPDLQRVRQVSAMCHALLRKARSDDSITLTLNVSTANSSDFLLRLLNGVGCLVATPAQLAWFGREAPGLLRFPRLQFLVYDDVDLMAAEQLRRAEQVVQELLPTTHYPQLVMVSQSYSEALMTKLRMLSSRPAVIFGDILEAALYGGTRIRISLVRKQEKSSEVMQLLQQRSPEDYRTVIYCLDDGEMRQLVRALEDRGFGCLPYYQTSDLAIREQVHSWLAKSRGLILLCTDSCPELVIRNAHTLIHHGMGDTWSKFKMRHLTISENLSNNLSGKPSHQVTLLSQVLLDNGNQRQLPRLVDFLQLHQQIDPVVLSVAQKIRGDVESTKSNKQAICGQILLLGECRDPVCEARHHVADLDLRPSHVPASGDVKVQLVRVYSPAHLCVRLEEHLPLNGTWQALPFLAVQEMRLKLLQDKEPHRYWPPVAGAICMHHTTLTKERVRVLKVAPIQDVNLLRSDISVEVQALDVDTRVLATQSGRLYECSLAMQQVPPMALDLRLLGMVPQSGESSWSEEERSQAEKLLKNLPKGHFLQANIQFATAGTLFVQDLVAMVYADNFKVHLRHLNLCQKLIKANLACRCESAKEKILEIFGEKLIVEERVEVEPKAKKVLEENKENWEVEPKAREVLEENKENCELEMKAKKILEQNKENCESTQERTLKNGDHVMKEKKSHQLLPPRCLRLMQIAREAFEEKDQEANNSQHEMGKPSPSNEDSMSQLYECIKNCALLELEEEEQSLKNTDQAVTNPAEFLKKVMSEESKDNRKPKKKSKAKSALPAKPISNYNKEMALQTHPNVVRPKVTYYQNITTLELQVCLPEDDLEYKAVLVGVQIFFKATSKFSDLIHQFVLTLKFPYTSLRHHRVGRTVYISVVKSLAFVDPLDFGEYRFLKPNHDMLSKMENYHKLKQTGFKRFLNNRGYVQQKVDLPHSSDYSDDEERNLDGIERVDHSEICD
ncbi:putative ATP-dependent RNA helicase BoYb [Drosophila takahashii]|uniref:putative ATP-dependent RNA helicase BoYb n=1 Tax=Drosophila takahashii TaxID=29030 RepID=UPI001CF81A3F|nr:putative ATP-dependent RNA helicase BoYb [Drosophila takahashii]